MLPPSDNHIRSVQHYKDPRGKLRTRIGYTKAAGDYKKEFVAWVDANHFLDVQQFVKGHKPYHVYELNLGFYFPEGEVLNPGWLKKATKDSAPGVKNPMRKGQRKAKSPYKRLDTLNRRKLIEDALSEVLGIDDSLTWEAHASKHVDTNNCPRVVIELAQADPECYGVPREYLED